MLTAVITQARKILHDEASVYRWSDADLVAWVNEGHREMLDKRPDLFLSAALAIQSFTDIPATGNYTYAQTGSPVTAQTGSHHLIAGWNRQTYPTLFFHSFAGGISRAYISDANRTTGIAAGDDTAAVFKFTDTSTGIVSITAVNTSGFSGQIGVVVIPTAADDWQIAATEQEMIFGINYDKSFVHFVCHKAFEMDSEDTANAGRSAYHYTRFLNQLYGDR